MKRLLPLLLLCLVACEPDPGPSRPVVVDGGNPEGGKTTRPRNHLNAVDSSKSGSTVSISDVLSFVERDCPSTKGILPTDVSVVPYLDSIGRDTLMYIVNYPLVRDDNQLGLEVSMDRESE